VRGVELMGENTRSAEQYEKSSDTGRMPTFQPSAGRYSQISDEVLDAWIAEFSAEEPIDSTLKDLPEITDEELMRILADVPAVPRRKPNRAHTQVEKKPQPVSNRPQPASNRPQPASNRPQPVSNRPQPASNRPQPGSNRPQPASNRPQPVSNRPVRKKKRKVNPVFLLIKGVVTLAAAVLSTVFTVTLVTSILTGSGAGGAGTSSSVNKAIMDHYDMFITNEIADALDGVLAIEKVHWLNDDDIAAPKPNPANYGQVDSPAELMWLLDEAKELIGDRELTFSENTPVWELDKIYYYYDETILVITWKQSMDGVIHTVSEVIVSHPSQFRRGLAGGTFGSDKQFTATEIAQSVNAVVATSGDFYKFRRNGVIVHNGELKRFEGESVDTCFIDDNGNLLFVKRGELQTEAQAKQYISDHNIRFSLAFGPVMVEEGRNVTPYNYEIGQIRGRYTRAAVAQKGDKHYLFVNTSSYMAYNLTDRLTLKEFSDNLIELGAQSAYALDGGQTTVIAMDGKLISLPDYEQQRQISDIIYFATALPDGE